MLSGSVIIEVCGLYQVLKGSYLLEVGDILSLSFR